MDDIPGSPIVFELKNNNDVSTLSIRTGSNNIVVTPDKISDKSNMAPQKYPSIRNIAITKKSDYRDKVIQNYKDKVFYRLIYS